MSSSEKLAMLESLLGMSFSAVEETMFETYLNLAGKEILQWRYSYAPSERPQEVPADFETIQIFAVVAGYSQQGAEGQSNHSENGISGTFKYADMVAYIRANVIPFVKVIMI